MADIKCPYMTKRRNGWCDEYFCTKVEHDVGYDIYRKYCTSYSYDDCSNYKYEKPSSGCYITTITCDILGLEDDNYFLNTLRGFRKNFLQRNPKTLEILEEYDFIGPIVASRIMNDENKKQIAVQLFKNNIVPITYDIFNGEYMTAIKRYTEMTKGLIKQYNLEALALTIPGESQYDFSKDYSEYGHGRRQLKR